MSDQLSAERRELPWVKIEKDYVFDTAGGRRTLADLFAGRNQLVIQHFMFGPDWQEGCPSCSFVADHIDGMLPHLAARDVTMVAVSRAPLAKIEAFKKRMGWQLPVGVVPRQRLQLRLPRVASRAEELAQGKVNYNFTHAGVPQRGERPGISVFYKDAAGDIFHTYSTYGRGVDVLMGTYRILDLVPKGRDEDQSGLLDGMGAASRQAMAPTSLPTRTNPTGRRTRRHRQRPAAVHRRRRTRERSLLLRDQCRAPVTTLTGPRRAAPWRGNRRLDCSQLYAGTDPQVSRMRSSLCGPRNRHRISLPTATWLRLMLVRQRAWRHCLSSLQDDCDT